MLVIVPFYNCEQWIERALRSLATQNYRNFRVIVADDASTDESSVIASKVCGQHGFTHWRNPTNKKCPKVIWDVMQWGTGDDPEEPVFILDGDDYLPHDNALAKIAKVYEDPDVWCTYGSYVSDPFDPLCEPALPYGPEVIAARSYRNCGGGNLFNHPLTWRTWFFKKLTERDFQDPFGQWFQAGYDRAFMYPMLEMATEYDGTYHWKYLSDILYTYNSVNPISDVHANMSHCVSVANYLIHYPVKEPVQR